MKRKFSLFLNVAVLALCVCAIAIGVYSAKTASLNVSGTVGFTAHDCKVAVTGTIVGHSTTADGAPETTPQAITSVTVIDTKTLNLGTVYFSDMTESGEISPITLTLNFENLSDFDVEVNITPQTISGITITPDKTSVILSNKSATEAEKKKTVIVTLTCASNSTGITPAEKQILQINMAKYTAPEGFTVQSGEIYGLTGNRNYVTMGTKDATALKWYIFAQGNGTTMSAVTTNLVENNAALPAGTYWFISEYVLDCDTANRNYGIQFDDSSNVYGTSDIKAYLDGTGSGTFANKYGITEEDAVYSQITARTLPAEEANGDVGAFTAVADQKLWLLSVSELKYLNNGTACSLDKTYDTLIAHDTSYAESGWWLRSPFADLDNVAFQVGLDGLILSIDVSLSYGVRAAFQITIAG